MKVEYNIPNVGKIIKLLANVYSDPRDALTEFIINSLDAGAKRIRIMIRNAKTNSIIVMDDGHGMDVSDMKRIIRNIGNSIKTDADELKRREIDAKQVIGHMGIGILGYQSFSEKAIFISKTKGSRDVWEMVLSKEDDRVPIKKVTESESLQFIGDESGTTIKLLYIPRDIMKLFSLTFLNQYLEKSLSELLRKRKDVKIILQDNKHYVEVKPLSFSGIPFSKNFVRTVDGKEIGINIYIQSSGTKDDVRIATKGKVVVKEIIRLPEFQHSPWIDGVLHGVIDADFLEVAPTRGDYIRDENFVKFVYAIKNIEHLLLEEIQKVINESNSQKRIDMVKKLRNAVSKALNDLEFEGSTVKVTDSKGKSSRGIIEGSPPPIEHTDNPRQEKHYRVNNNIKKRLLRTRNRSGLNLKWDHLGNPYLHSTLREGGLIVVNEDAEDYMRIRKTQSLRKELSYLVKIVAKELSKYNNPKADIDTVMESSISLEIKILEYLKI